MLHSARFNCYRWLGVLAILSGCALPANPSRPLSLAAVTHPLQALRATRDKRRPDVIDGAAIAPVSYRPPARTEPKPSSHEQPAAAGLEPPLPIDGPALPADVTLSDSEPARRVVRFAQDTPRSTSPPPQSAVSLNGSADPFQGKLELSLDQLVAEVQARNPSLQAASAAWRAAAERYPQVVSLDDPMLAYMIGPSSIGEEDGGGWMVQASQNIPWSGKRALRGSVAAAESDVARGAIGDTRLQLIEASHIAFYDYYLAWRLTEVNQSTRDLVTQLRAIALSKYQVNQVTQQDVLQADVEVADLETRGAQLDRDQQVAAARINRLLHRAADHPLPPPPRSVSLPDGLPAADVLQQTALRSRPDLYAQLAQIRAEEADLALACREYYPDVNLVAKYDGFMPEDMRPQVGMDVNLPIRRARRDAAVREASARLAQRRAQYQDRLDQVRYEVQAALTRVTQAAEVVRLYQDRTLPSAERSLQSAQANYTTGTLDFLRLLDAERQFNEQREKYHDAIALYHRQLAELDRAVGQPVR